MSDAPRKDERTVVDLRSAFAHNGKLLFVLVAVFGLPLPVLSLASGLNGSIAVLLLFVVCAATWGIWRLLEARPIDWSSRVSRARAVGSAALALVLVALLIQAVPYGRSHDNPPVLAEPQWDSERTRELMVKACFDCHSNEVEYPWYASVAPISWAVQSHVDAGRGDVNYSEWNREQKKADESAETVEEGSMPPWYYTWRRPGLLSEVEKQDLIRGLKATAGTHENGMDGDEHDDDDDD